MVLLRRHVYVCHADGGAVFMDLNTERYLGVDQAVTRVLQSTVSGWSDPETQSEPLPGAPKDMSVILELVDRGILTRSSEEGWPAAFLNLAPTDCIPFKGTLLPYPALEANHVFNFAAAYMQSRMELRMRKLLDIVNRIRGRKAVRPLSAEYDTAEVVQLVRVFRFLSALAYTAMNACLLDSLVLVEFLARYDVFPTWLFGIRTRPFEAHSWVQLGGLLLNDRLEKIDECSALIHV